MLTECSIWSSGDTSDVVGDDHFTEYSMTSEHHGDITVQTEAELSSYQMGIKLKRQNSDKHQIEIFNEQQNSSRAWRDNFRDINETLPRQNLGF